MNNHIQSIIDSKEKQLKEKVSEKPISKRSKDGSCDASRSEDHDRKRKHNQDKVNKTVITDISVSKESISGKGERSGSFPTKQFKAVEPDEDNSDSSDSDLLH